MHCQLNEILLHAHQTLQMGSAAPAVFHHVWSHTWQTLHQDFSCLAAETKSKFKKEINTFIQQGHIKLIKSDIYNVNEDLYFK